MRIDALWHDLMMAQSLADMRPPPGPSAPGGIGWQIDNARFVMSVIDRLPKAIRLRIHEHGGDDEEANRAAENVANGRKWNYVEPPLWPGVRYA